VKVHACVDTGTHIITALQVTENTVGDAPMLPELVLRTHLNGFIMDKVVADAAYLSTNNIRAIQGVGADAYIAFKSNSTGAASPLLGKLFHRFITERDVYDTEYHSRSNVETVFLDVEDALRSPRALAQADRSVQRADGEGALPQHRVPREAHPPLADRAEVLDAADDDGAAPRHGHDGARAGDAVTSSRKIGEKDLTLNPMTMAAPLAKSRRVFESEQRPIHRCVRHDDASRGDVR